MAPRRLVKVAAATGCVAATASPAFVVVPAGSVAAGATQTQRQQLEQVQLRGAPSAQLSGRSSSGSSAPLIACAGAVLSAAVLGGRRREGTSAARPSATAVRAFENELGVQAPVGFWDPAGLASDSTPGEFFRRRCVEIKHGRIAMLACIGYIVPEYVRFPGLLSPSTGVKFVDVPNGLAALTKVPAVGWAQYIVFCGLCELFLMNQEPEETPGKLKTRLFGESLTNYEYGFLGLPGYLGGKGIPEPELRKKKLNSEIANGRLAMVAILAMFFQNGTVGTTGPEMWLPGSAFENELGVQAPVGFWDPAGLASDSTPGEFFRRRCVEIKHGRIAMLACIGYIVPEYVRFPGLLSPSTGVKFVDVPNGLAALTKVPAVGWAQYIVFCGLCELFLMNQEPEETPGKLKTRLFGESLTNYEYGFLGLPGYLGGKGIPEPELRKKKLNSEIANGRLAMVAILAMFFQNGTVGTTGPEMWLPGSAFENELGVQARSCRS